MYVGLMYISQTYSDTVIPLYKKLHSLIYGKTEYNSWISYKNRSFFNFFM